MSDARILHKKAGASQKVNTLTNLEYRVWTQYLISANDFGVMPAIAAILQTDNLFLRREKCRLVQGALEQVITVGLVCVFVHQGESFVWQPDWQTWQGVRYPRHTIHPPPPMASLCELADAKTLELFENYFREKGEIIPADTLKSCSEKKSLACAGMRDTLTQTLPLTPTLPKNTETFAALFQRFWTAYPRKVGKGEAERRLKVLQPDGALVDAMIRALGWQVQQPQWAKDGGKFIPHASTWLNGRRWEDEPFHVPALNPLAANDAGWSALEAELAAKP